MKIKSIEIHIKEIPKKVLKRVWRTITDLYLGLRADYYLALHNVRRQKEKLPIRVGFIVQMPEIWDKEEPIYQAMHENPLFSTDLLVVPEYDFVNKEVDTTFHNRYFFEKYPDAISAINETGWIDIAEGKYDYVFYQRPYNQYLPKQLCSRAVVNKSKICYVPYAFWPLKEHLCGYNTNFFRDAYFSFLESAENADIIRKRIRPNRKIVFCGYPALEARFDYTNIISKQVLWTPRWSYDAKVGGSHFFEYKDYLTELFSELPEWKLVVRPHPLAFENYIAQGLMSSEEKEQYINSLSTINGKLDNNKIIEDTFKETAILISDISSVIFTFFITGKPIIYCSSTVDESPAFIALKRGMYVANTWDEVENYVVEIIKGNDPLNLIRNEIATQLINKNKNATNNIIQHIIDDYKRHTTKS